MVVFQGLDITVAMRSAYVFGVHFGSGVMKVPALGEQRLCIYISVS